MWQCWKKVLEITCFQKMHDVFKFEKVDMYKILKKTNYFTIHPFKMLLHQFLQLINKYH